MFPPKYIISRGVAKGVKTEDIILYSFCFLLLAFLSFYSWQLKNETNHDYISEYDKLMIDDLKLGKALNESDNPQNIFLKAQLQLIYKRYGLANRLSVTNANIKFVSFIIGSLLCILGTMVVVRGVRESTIDLNVEALEKAKVKFLVTSPGIFVVFAGTAIIITSILSGNKIDVTDNNIVPISSQNELLNGDVILDKKIENENP